ncbi:prepilin peptidase [Buttiauxella izardii]|uniref:Prepilin peptidase n=1 Tax=Buttiauxella izardii TaxID=82991 RepID=A0A3A5JN95_9ENTR|nr:A24 family peptidase [Buttiauxella izardii]RJT20923.1 prepilin peptidase [Buttiauxella izardii]
MHPSPSLAFILFIGLHILLLIRLAWIDYRLMLLPDRLNYPLLWSGLLFQICFAPEQLSDCVLGAIIGYTSLWLLYWIYYYWRGCEGIGYGDMKLLAALGAWHGWRSLGWITLAAATSGLICALVAKILLKSRLSLTTTPLPFGPNLAIAGGSVGWIYSSFPQLQELNFLL